MYVALLVSTHAAQLTGHALFPVSLHHGNLCHVQVGCHGVLAEAAMRGHVLMVKTLCQKYHCKGMYVYNHRHWTLSHQFCIC